MEVAGSSKALIPASSTWHYFPEVSGNKVGESSQLCHRNWVRALQDVVSSQGMGFRLLMVLPRESTMNWRFKLLIWFMQSKKVLCSLFENVLF